jgi:hypothetical protein
MREGHPGHSHGLLSTPCSTSYPASGNRRTNRAPPSDDDSTRTSP